MKFEQLLKRNKTPSKHQVLKYFIATADSHSVCDYYFDKNLKQMPREILYEYLKELETDGYVKKRQRHIVLTGKAYSYPDEYRMRILNKVLSVLGRPVSYLLTWILGILSALIIQYLINVLNLNP